MYCSFYGLKEKPFAITPNPRFLFFSKNHREAFAHLLYGIDNHAGFIEFTGEVGTGKTTVLRTLLNQLGEDRYRTALIFNPALSALELLRLINREYGIAGVENSNADLLDALYRFLLHENAAGRTVVLIIDEAQNLDPMVLEQIRLISNLETETDKLMQIVLAGQPELSHLLARPDLRQINQRITVRYHLRPLDADDSKAYIEHRLEVAGGRWVVAFTKQALAKLFRETRGIPRLINIMCDRALLICFSNDRREISGSIMAQAIREVRGELQKGNASRSSYRRVFAAVAIVVAVALALVLKFSPSFSPGEQKKESPPPVTAATVASGATGTVLPLNAIFAGWNISPLPKDGSLGGFDDIDRLCRANGLRVAPFRGSFGLLRRIDVPALLEFSLPGVQGNRYLAWVGSDRDKMLIEPPLGQRTAVTSTDLENLWSGRAYLFWKDPDNLPLPITPASKGPAVKKVQELLRVAAGFRGNATGRYDKETVQAVKNFQGSWGIAADGRVGESTLLLLYRAAGAPTFPRLAGNERRVDR